MINKNKTFYRSLIFTFCLLTSSLVFAQGFAYPPAKDMIWKTSSEDGPLNYRVPYGYRLVITGVGSFEHNYGEWNYLYINGKIAAAMPPINIRTSINAATTTQPVAIPPLVAQPGDVIRTSSRRINSAGVYRYLREAFFVGYLSKIQ